MKVRQQQLPDGYSYRRTWRKLHIGVNEATHEIVAAMATLASSDDASQVPELLDQVEDEIKQVSADGAYDSAGVYDAIVAYQARATVKLQNGETSERGGALEVGGRSRRHRSHTSGQ